MLVRSNRRVLILFVLALAAFLSWWLSSTGPSLIPRLDQQRHDPDYYLVNFMLTTMGDDGVPKHQLKADNMFHYPDDDTANLKNPEFLIYRNGADSWNIRSEHGLISEGGKSVMLQGDVFIEQLDALSDKGLEIMTRDLNIKPDEEFASTEQAIVIKNRYGVTEAVGMQADLKKRRVLLMSQVRGNYQSFYE